MPAPTAPRRIWVDRATGSPSPSSHGPPSLARRPSSAPAASSAAHSDTWLEVNTGMPSSASSWATTPKVRREVQLTNTASAPGVGGLADEVDDRGHAHLGDAPVQPQVVGRGDLEARVLDELHQPPGEGARVRGGDGDPAGPGQAERGHGGARAGDGVGAAGVDHRLPQLGLALDPVARSCPRCTRTTWSAGRRSGASGRTGRPRWACRTSGRGTCPRRAAGAGCG